MYQEQVREIYEKLSPSYRRIADYLLNHHRDVAFMTAAQLGRAASADTTSVVRFAQRLGYPGFPELIAEIQEEVKRELSRVFDSVPQENAVVAQFQRSLIEDRRNLEYILSHNEDHEVEVVVRLIAAAGRILIVGESAANLLAEQFALRLCALGLHAWALPEDGLARMTLSIFLGPQDLLIGLSPILISEGIGVVLQLARQAGSQTLAIAGTANIRAAQVAEHVLYAPSRAPGLFYSTTGPTAVINALLQAVTLLRSDQSAHGAMRVNHLLSLYVEAQRIEATASLRDAIQDWTASEGDIGGHGASV